MREVTYAGQAQAATRWFVKRCQCFRASTVVWYHGDDGPSFAALHCLSATKLGSLKVVTRATSDTLNAVGHMVSLNKLQVECARGCTLDSLQTLTKLVHLEISTHASSLRPLAGLQNLQRLIVSHCNAVTSLDGLQSLTSLSWLSISNSQVPNLEPLAGLLHWHELYADDCNMLTSLDGLQALTNLQKVAVRRSKLPCLKPLAGLA